jgi:cytochrome P450
LDSATTTEPTAWTPPGITPPERDPHPVVLGLRALDDQIRGWSRKLFYEDAWRPAPGLPLYVTSPQALQTPLVDRALDFGHGAMFRRMMRVAWGRGVLTADEASWRWQRRASAHAFRPTGLAGLAPRISAATEAALDSWLGETDPSPLDTPKAVNALTFRIIVDTMLSGAEHFDADAMQQRIAAFFGDITRLRLSYFLAPDAYHAQRPDAASHHRAPLLEDISGMVAARRSARPRGDLVDLLIAAHDPETGAAMDDALIADNLMGFILAGHETTSVALTWALYVLAAHPETAAGIRAEVRRVAGDAPLTSADASALVFTRQVISEVLRLYPPGFLLTRVALRDCELAGHRVKAGSRVNVPVYAVHRHRVRWPNPDAFDPGRFASDAQPPGRHVYLPFGSGPRICMGASFAMLESVIVLASVARRVDLACTDARPPVPHARFSLWPRGGLRLNVTPAQVP